ncbi:hypothetical protein CCAE64S_01507 [Castellaniella caeni]
MFNRSYMEYHSDRFSDKSLVFRDGDTITAVFPANIVGDCLFSHQGLTFGGLVVSHRATTLYVINLFNELFNFSKKIGVRKIIYKRLPDFYAIFPAQDDLYALFMAGAKLYRRDINSTINLSMEYRYTKGRKWSVNKAKKNNIFIEESKNFDGFWNVLNEVLFARHGVAPVHSIDEITILEERFPDNIKLFTACKDGEILAGCLLFIEKNVVHTQYLANSGLGRDLGALDYLIDFLLAKYSSEKKYFDFGISTEDEGKVINDGLLAQKEGFGARCTVHDFYEIELK